MKTAETGGYFGLSTNQKNILDAEISSKGTSVNNIAVTVCFEGLSDTRLLADAVHSVIMSDSSLRTRLSAVNGETMQYHAPYDSPEIPVLDFSMSDEDGYMHWADEQAREPVFCYDGPLYRFAVCKITERRLNLFICTHHIISDGWTQLSLCNRIARVYLDLLGGRPVQVPQTYDYADYVADEQKYLSSPAYARDSAYWKSVFAGYPEAAEIKRVRGAVRSSTCRRVSFRLPDTLGNAVNSYCRMKGVSPFTVLYTALAAVLRRSGCSGKITVGVPVFNRRTEAFRNTTGMFVSTVPFVCDNDDSQDFDSFCDSVNEAWTDAMRHQRYPYADIVDDIKSPEPLFGIMLSYQEGRIIDSTDEPARVTGIWHCSGFQNEQLCIHLTDIDGSHNYGLRYDYLTQVLTEKDVSALHAHILRILNSALSDPHRSVSGIPLTDGQERERVAGGYNRTDHRFPPLTPYEMILRATRGKEKRAAAICDGVRITYGDLLKKGRQIAASLDRGCAAAAILLPRGPELLAAVCAAMQRGYPFCIVNPSYPEKRISAILELSGAGYLVSGKELAAPFLNGKIRFADAYSPEGEYMQADRQEPGQTAYIVFTSGSTGTPKGVAIGRESLCNLAWCMEEVYGTDSVLSVCNQSFDAYILESAAAMMCGRTVIIAEDDESENPAALGRLIRDFGAGFIATTPSRMAAFMNNSVFREAASRLETIICGGEIFTSDLLGTLRKYTSARIYNQYGPSEATVAVCMDRIDNSDRITVGRPMKNCRIYVLDEAMNPLPENVTGEIFIGGACVGKGYINSPEQTAASFIPSPFVFGETLYRTGDIGMFCDDGRVVIIGRRDGQVKIRGLRIETGEIASCISSYGGVSAAAAKATEKNGQIIIVGYYVSENEIPEMELLAYTARYLPKYMIPAGIVRVGEIPLTQNGKINEKALPEMPDMPGNTSPANERQARIVGIFRKVLGNDGIGAGSSYFLCGGNSLNAMETVGLIEDAFGVRMPVSALYACRTAEGVDRYLDTSAVTEKAVVRTPVTEGDYPVTPTEQSIYIASSGDATGRTYMMPCAFELEEMPDPGVIAEAFRRLIADDPVFRTSYGYGEGGLRAHVHGSAAFDLPVFGDGQSGEATEYILEPFDLSCAPLLRGALFMSREGRPTLLVNVHHIICDGLSVPVIMNRLDSFIRGEKPGEHMCFRELCASGTDEALKKARSEYWKKKLAGIPAFADIPTDRPRPAVFDGAGADITVRMGKDVSAAADRIAGRFGITPYVLFAGAAGILRSRLCGDESVVIGTPVSGRIKPGTEDIVGPVMRTVPLRMDVRGRIDEYFGAVRMSSAEMIDNSDCGIGEIAGALGLPHMSDRNPVYQVLFQMRPVDVRSFTLMGRHAEYVPVRTGRSKLDISCECERTDEGYTLYIEYASSLYDSATVEFRAKCIGDIIMAIDASEDGTDVRNIPMPAYLPECVREEVGVIGIHKRISEICGRTPDSTAVIFRGERISFAALEKRACEIAGYLAENGARKGDFIGICTKRTPDLLASLIAILKNGCAYVPFLDSFPAERIARITKTAGVKLVLADDDTAECAANAPGEFAVLRLSEAAGAADIAAEVCAGDPMYVLFTSGSTGQPKGVEISVGAIENLLCEEKRMTEGLNGPVLCTSNYTFDIFITESLLALARGACVVLADDEEAYLPWKLAGLIEEYRPEMAQFTPSRLRMCLKNGAFERAARLLKYTIVAGENVPPSLVSEYAGVTHSKLVNMYGPTESAVYVTAGELLPGEPVTIGRPLRNCRLYVLDDDRRPVIPGRRGELYIGGICLSKGYVSEPDLTSAAFFDDPFVPGEKMYKSGDIVRQRTDGRFECFGRLDGQIKINGIRVETGEINEALLACGASGAVTCVRKNPDGSSAAGAVVTPGNTDISLLKAKLAEKLPPYMIPSPIIPIDAIPVNPSGKADMPLIRELLSGAGNAQKPAGEKHTDTGADMPASVWAAALGRDDIDPDVTFFEQGGSSLTALNVIGEYYNRGIVMTLQQFYANPTLRGQRGLIAGKKKAETAPAAPVRAASAGDGLRAGPKKEKGDILLTGSTGFLGIHLLRELLAKENCRIICLTRDGSRERLERLMGFYFGGVLPEAGRIDVVRGDILRDRFGTDGETYSMLLQRVASVVHAAADVRHYSSDSLISETNIEGTRRTAGFALEAGAEFAHISTASICGTFVESAPDRYFVFTENDTDIGQDRDNEYIRAKLSAEETVAGYRERGLRARVFRVGRLIGRRDDGMFQINPGKNAFRRIAGGFCAVGAYPAGIAGARTELLPVDVCAEAIVRLLRAEGDVFHVVNPYPMKLCDVFGHLPCSVRQCSDGEFAHLLGEALGTVPERVSSLVDYLNTLSSRPQRIALSCEKTAMILRDTGFDWSGDIGNGLNKFTFGREE